MYSITSSSNFCNLVLLHLFSKQSMTSFTLCFKTVLSVLSMCSTTYLDYVFMSLFDINDSTKSWRYVLCGTSVLLDHHISNCLTKVSKLMFYVHVGTFADLITPALLGALMPVLLSS